MHDNDTICYSYLSVAAVVADVLVVVAVETVRRPPMSDAIAEVVATVAVGAQE